MAIKVTYPEYVPQFNGDQGLILSFPEAASQSFLAGDPVKLVSGKVTLAQTKNNNLGAVVLLGFAEEKATGVTDTMIRVRCARPGDQFIMPILAGQTFAVTDVATTGLDIFLPTTGAPTVAKGTATNPKVVILGTEEKDLRTGASAATAGGPVRVKIMATNGSTAPSATVFFSAA